MQIRRRLAAENSILVETRDHPDEEWAAGDARTAFGFESPFAPSWEAERALADGVAEGDLLLPFQPLSFRDFMLYEQHNIDAARGYVGRYRRGVAGLARAYEAVTRSVFPAFRPKPLWYRQPIYYMGNAATIVPSGTVVRAPGYTKALDYELELAFVLRSPLLDASPAEAEQAIGAFVVLCDFSARDVQIAEMNSGFGPQKAKHFLTSLSSTAVSAADVLPQWTKLRARVEINGKTVANPDAGRSRWSLGEVLAHASAGERLHAGELFATGTFVGGSGMEIGRWLQPGDYLRLDIDGVGTVEHRIL
ncbi:Fumarylacetoacetate (FAA) hydrolase family protein [Lentzea xinjiangensis]|uniref:Fumarylacetoacetate (FAA) hydrolase family protein n=1 Tax=Lentzea xinjiangensis TaxID=402600 RepID=A0A1H9SVW2_9PSEU|nr:fumarylacetoacetate hydrolase family protein [Lentzea xinjiangensis]SER88954.1 Fumarylacetoacetate (FAA) hydrolase family protein [Lentzea xinjiangensis]